MDTLLNFINSLTLHQWFLIGGLLASIPGTIAITEWVKRHHVKVKTEKLWSGFVVLNVTVWSFLLTTADAISANLGQVTHIGSLIPQIAPFVAQYAPTVSIAALTVHTVATALSKWWADRKAKKPITNVNMPDLQAVAATEASPTFSQNPSPSFGTASAGVDVTPPPANLFN